MLIDEDDHNELYHYGVKRRSGRYPWGSGQTPEERGASFLSQVSELRKQGLSDTEIARAFSSTDPNEPPFTTTKLRATIAIAGNVKKQADILQAQRLKAKGMSNTAISERMFGSKSKESNVRALLEPGAKDKADILNSTADMLRSRVDEGKFVDIGKGVANRLGLSSTRLATAASMLESEGYAIHQVPVPQAGRNQDTRTRVLCPPGTEKHEVTRNLDKIVGITDFTNDKGRTWNEVKTNVNDLVSVDSKRVQVVWGPEGGNKADGVIYVRPNAKGLDMGGAHYLQTRILVDGSHYLKGMAVQKDDLPPGVDLQFHTNKAVSSNKHDAMKPIKADPDNPFGSSISRQIQDAHGKPKSAINIVNDEASWDDWSRNLASQMLSKQKPTLVKSQLDVTYEKKKAQLDEILSLTNPTVRERLLRSYADDMDASAVHLKAAAMPRQKTHVILPINSLKENEIYAPGYKDGETLVLIRYPHGGTFEIPELTVNNRNAEGNRIIKPGSTAAVGINHKVAQRLSGADFDGDTVVVIPNNHRRITTTPPLEGLKGFDPQHEYPGKDSKGNPLPGVKFMTNTQTEMGKISNLITDMTIAGAGPDELARAVRHSMVVIDAEKHSLNYQESARRNGISELRKRYQPGKNAGASTIISRSTGERKVPDFKPRPAKDGGPIDKATGKLVFVPSGKMRNKRVVDKVTGEVTWVPQPVMKSVQRGSLVDNAFDLIDGEGMPVERLYAQYSNKVRDLANSARLEMVNNTKAIPYNPSAKAVYHKEVSSLNAKLDEAYKNAPLERQAQVVANSIIKMKKADNPNLYTDRDLLKKVESQALRTARARTGADKQQVDITPKEWEAIQAGAITSHKLKEILNNTDVDKIKQLAMPRTTVTMSPIKMSRARSLANAGYTQADIAAELGVSVSTLRRSLNTTS